MMIKYYYYTTVCVIVIVYGIYNYNTLYTSSISY